MSFRVRHCVECPKCKTRYLVGFSPYANGSHLVALSQSFQGEWTLYCSCANPPVRSYWRWSELEMYIVTRRAFNRGYGAPGEIELYGSAQNTFRLGATSRRMP